MNWSVKGNNFDPSQNLISTQFMWFTLFLVQASVNSSHKPGGKGHQQTDERLGPPDCPRSRTGECSNKGLGWGGGYLNKCTHWWEIWPVQTPRWFIHSTCSTLLLFILEVKICPSISGEPELKMIFSYLISILTNICSICRVNGGCNEIV